MPPQHLGMLDLGISFRIEADDGDSEAVSEGPPRPVKEILVIIPRGVRYRVDVDSIPGATCLKIPVEVAR